MRQPPATLGALWCSGSWLHRVGIGSKTNNAIPRRRTLPANLHGTHEPLTKAAKRAMIVAIEGVV